VLPKKQMTFSFDDFDLSGLATINYRPIGDELLIETLRTGAESRSHAPAPSIRAAPRGRIVGPLIGRDEIAYDENADLLYKLAGQIVGGCGVINTDAE
jgi:type III restriction enzyme